MKDRMENDLQREKYNHMNHGRDLPYHYDTMTNDCQTQNPKMSRDPFLL